MTIIQTTKPLRKRNAVDFYETPSELAEAAVKLIPMEFDVDVIHDPGAGTGVWGRACWNRWPHSVLVGIDPNFRKPRTDAYSHWAKTDYLKFVEEVVEGPPNDRPDLVIGNPPFKFAEPFVRAALASLTRGGHLLFFLRLSFLEGQRRGDGLWKTYPPHAIYVLQQRPSFTGDGKTDDTAWMLCHWIVPKQITKPTPTILRWLSWR